MLRIRAFNSNAIAHIMALKIQTCNKKKIMIDFDFKSIKQKWFAVIYWNELFLLLIIKMVVNWSRSYDLNQYLNKIKWQKLRFLCYIRNNKVSLHKKLSFKYHLLICVQFLYCTILVYILSSHSHATLLCYFCFFYTTSCSYINIKY